MADDPVRDSKARWIFHCGAIGLCPRSGEGPMFRKWLKLQDTCPHCDLDYGFAAPDDGQAFFSLCIVAFPLTFFVVWLQVRFDPPFWVHLLISVPLVGFGCVLPLKYIKGWLVASQYINKAQEAGTERLWADLNARGQTDPSGLVTVLRQSPISLRHLGLERERADAAQI
jgi:uncharacterized protein (DUF983 family)